MRIISRKRLVLFWAKEPHAMQPLRRWHKIMTEAAWKDLTQVKRTFGANVDFVQVRSGRTVAVMDIGGNKWRLIAAIHFQNVHHAKGRVYVLRILSHADYDRKKWVDER